MANTPLLGQFLVAINGFIQARNEISLAEYLTLEPPFNSHYIQMQAELQRAYPRGSESALESKVSATLRAATDPADLPDGSVLSPWTAVVKFMAQYLGYLRDVTADASQYLHTYELLSELQQRGNSALSHAELGHLILPTIITNARLVCRLAIGLDKQPELISHLKSAQPGNGGGGEDGGARETLPERAANILRQAFVTCLNDRMSGMNPSTGKPEAKKKGIYIIANLCLKILFQCRKTRNATQIFENIYNLSPPLSAYPKRERVTYLYYLGRYLWQNSHFHRAQLVLQYAYDECPANQQGVRQRRSILIYLIASNIILGRFPSANLLSRPEAQGLSERFMPLCLAIRSGDLAAYNRHLAFDGEHAEWFLHFRILLQLRNRCEALVWRSVVRKVWILNGTRQPLESRAAPTISLLDLVTAFSWLERRSPSDSEYIDPDFVGLPYDDAIGNEVTVASVESKLASLVDQGLVVGFISHRQLRFAITGTKKGGDVMAIGFPKPAAVMSAKVKDETDVPGWKQKSGVGGGVGAGSVLHMTGVREIGAM